jgi:nucleoid-associated protein YgaU
MSRDYRYYERNSVSVINRKSGSSLYKVIITSLFLIVAITFVSAKVLIVKAEQNTTKTYQKMYTSVVVEAGDTVWNIAEENMTSGYKVLTDLVEEIGFINGLDEEYSIRSGSVIIIPYYGEV